MTRCRSTCCKLCAQCSMGALLLRPSVCGRMPVWDDTTSSETSRRTDLWKLQPIHCQSVITHPPLPISNVVVLHYANIRLGAAYIYTRRNLHCMQHLRPGQQLLSTEAGDQKRQRVVCGQLDQCFVRVRTTSLSFLFCHFCSSLFLFSSGLSEFQLQ